MQDHKLHAEYDKFVSRLPEDSIFGKQFNIWLYGDYSSMYIRVCPTLNTLTLSNLNVEPDFQNKGILKSFVKHIKQDSILVENASSELVPLYQHLGFHILHQDQLFDAFQMQLMNSQLLQLDSAFLTLDSSRIL